MTNPSDFELPKKRKDGKTLEDRMTANAYQRILPARYLNKDEEGNVTETPEELFERVAENVAQPAKEYEAYDYENTKEEFYNLMTELKFMPNSPTLMNMGDELQMGSACFVLHPEDDMESIFNTSRDAALTFKDGGGMGYPFHLLRPKGDIVKSTGGISSGPMSFMEVFDTTCFPGHTEVLTPSGFKQIEALTEGDRVINRDGETEEVAEKKVRELDEEIVELELSRLNKTIEVTKEHPFQVSENGKLNWKEAQELTEEDNVVIQSMEEETPLDEELDLANLVTGHFIIRDTELELSREFYNADKGTASSFTRSISKESFANLVGWYLAEGCVSYQRGIPSTVNFTLHIDEDKYRDEILQDLDEMSLDYTVTETPERTKQDITIHNSSFAAFIENIFGCGYDTKQVPEFFWKAKTETQLEIVEALFKGDGHLQKRNEGRSQRASFKLANKELIDFVWHVGMKEGVQFSRSVERNQSKSDAYSAKVSVSSVQGTGFERLFDEVPEETRLTDRTKQELLLHPKTETKQEKQVVGIKSIETKSYKGKVHNLTVTGDHTYVAEGVAVHNCGTIKQGGVRRGAQMGIMRVDHPDILRFIVAKRKEGKLSNFNISVGFTDDFMEAVKNDEEIEMINPRTDDVFQTSRQTVEFYSSDPDNYPRAEGSDTGKDDNFWRDFADNFESDVESYRNDLENLEEGEPFKLPAKFIFEAIIDGAWRNGEPGFYHYDEYNTMHSYDIEEKPEKKIEACNPCGEQGLMNGEACNLGHVNLSLLVEDDAPKYEEYSLVDVPVEELPANASEETLKARGYLKEALDMDELERICRSGTRFLDNVVSMNDWPTEEIRETAEKNRKIGLGLMGFAQMLIQMGVRYGSDESIALAKEVQRLITKYAVEESHRLAETKGKFPDWDESKWAEPTEYEDWFNVYAPEVDTEKHSDGYEVRNHNMVTIAPTGTTSMLGDTSGGCEPIFSLAYFKNVAKDIQGEDMLVEFDDYFIKALEHNDVDVEKVKADAQEKMENNEWNGVQSISDDILPPRVKEYFATADQVTAEEHMRIQAAFQTHNHSGISKTCNFPNTATREDVKKAYLTAHDLGIKGMTVYRAGSRDTQVMQENKDNKVIEKIDVKQWIDDASEEEIEEIKQKIEGGEE